MAISSMFSATFSLLVVSINAASTIHETRQGGLRYQKAVGRQPDAVEQDQEALTREDIMQQDAPQSVAEGAGIPPASQPAMQISQFQQRGQPQQVVPPMQAQQLLQAQAMQMQQMQQQLQQQQKELQRLQQNEKQPHQDPARLPSKPVQTHQLPRPQHKHASIQAPKKALVGVGAKVMTKSEMESGSGSSGISKPKGWDQCLKFARFVKFQDVTGVELVRVWKSTCEPAVQSGRATERYKLMCNSLSGVVEPYAAQIDYDVEQLCDSVLAVFHDVTAVDVKNR